MTFLSAVISCRVLVSDQAFKDGMMKVVKPFWVWDGEKVN